MTNVRTFVRFTFAALFVNALAVACVVENGDGDDTSDACDPGSVQTCACGSEESTKKCNASGSGYGVCDCGSGAGGSGSGGSGSEGGTPGSSGGPGGLESGGNGSAGESSSAGGHASGGVAGADTGAAGSDVGGAAGAGGAGSELPAECTAEGDDCETCYQACCDDWVACSDNSDCLVEYFDILECINTTKEGLGAEPFKPEHLAACADGVGTAGGAWSSGLTSETVAMVNCLGGDPTDSSWAEMSSWGADSCKDLCF